MAFSYDVSMGTVVSYAHGSGLPIEASDPPVVVITNPSFDHYPTNAGALVPITAPRDSFGQPSSKSKYFLATANLARSPAAAVATLFLAGRHSRKIATAALPPWQRINSARSGTSQVIHIDVTPPSGATPPVARFDNLINPTANMGESY